MANTHPTWTPTDSDEAAVWALDRATLRLTEQLAALTAADEATLTEWHRGIMLGLLTALGIIAHSRIEGRELAAQA